MTTPRGLPPKSTLRIAVGWDMTARDPLDLDAACSAFDASGLMLDLCYFRNTSAMGGAMLHSGDSRTGLEDGDDEVITLEFSLLPPHVLALAVTLHCYTEGRDLSATECTKVTMYRNGAGEVPIEQHPPFGQNASFVLFMFLRLPDGAWNLSVPSVGIPAPVRTPTAALPTILSLLRVTPAQQKNLAMKQPVYRMDKGTSVAVPQNMGTIGVGFGWVPKGSGILLADITAELEGEFSQSLIEQLYDLLKRHDVDGDATFSMAEFSKFLQELYFVTGTAVPMDNDLGKSVKEMFRQYDKDNSWSLDLKEFCTLLRESKLKDEIKNKWRSSVAVKASLARKKEDAAKGGGLDLDGMAVVLNNRGLVAGVVDGRTVVTATNARYAAAISHMGDHHAGKTKGGDAELIVVRLAALPPDISHIFFALNVRSTSTFTDVKGAFCRIFDRPSAEAKGPEFCRYDSLNHSKYGGFIFACLHRDVSKPGWWRYRAIGEYCEETNISTQCQALQRMWKGIAPPDNDKMPPQTSLASRRSAANLVDGSGVIFLPALCRVHEAKALLACDRNGFSDPYVKVTLVVDDVKMSNALLRTKTIPKTLNPSWETDKETFILKDPGVLLFEVMDEDFLVDDFIGRVCVPMPHHGLNGPLPEWFHLEDKNGKPAGLLRVTFTPLR